MDLGRERVRSGGGRLVKSEACRRIHRRELGRINAIVGFVGRGLDEAKLRCVSEAPESKAIKISRQAERPRAARHK